MKDNWYEGERRKLIWGLQKVKEKENIAGASNRRKPCSSSDEKCVPIWSIISRILTLSVIESHQLKRSNHRIGTDVWMSHFWQNFLPITANVVDVIQASGRQLDVITVITSRRNINKPVNQSRRYDKLYLVWSNTNAS